MISNFDLGGESSSELKSRLVGLADQALDLTLSEAVAVAGASEYFEAMIADLKASGDHSRIPECSRTLRALKKRWALLQTRAIELERTVTAIRAHG